MYGSSHPYNLRSIGPGTPAPISSVAGQLPANMAASNSLDPLTQLMGGLQHHQQPPTAPLTRLFTPGPGQHQLPGMMMPVTSAGIPVSPIRGLPNGTQHGTPGHMPMAMPLNGAGAASAAAPAEADPAVALPDAENATENETALLGIVQSLSEQLSNLLPIIASLQAADHSRSSDSFFLSAELATMQMDLDPASIPEKLTLFAGRLRFRNRLAYEILTYTDAQWAALMHQPVYTDADEITSRALMAILVPEAPHVKRFLGDLAKSPDIMASGRALFIAIQSLTSFELCEEAFDFEELFKSNAYFIAGQTIVQAKLAADQLEKDFALLPGAMRAAPHALLYALLDKMALIPSLVAESKSLRADIWKRSQMGKATYTYKQLAGLVAMHVSKAPPIPIRPIAV